MRVTIEIVWTLGGRRKTSEVYCADSAAELENIRQYFIAEKKKIASVPTAGQSAWFEAAGGQHPYGWEDAANAVEDKPFSSY